MFNDVDHEEVEEVLIEVLDEFHFSLGAPEMAYAAADGPAVSAVVDVIGSSTGAVVVTTTTNGARPLASVLLDTAPEDLTDEDIADAVGELTNLLAGGLKALVDEETSLGTPGPGASYDAAQAIGIFQIEHQLVTFSLGIFNNALSTAS